MSVGLIDYQSSKVPMSVFSPIGVVEESAVERLDRKAADIGTGLSRLLADLASQIIGCPNAKEFIEFRTSIFGSYMDLMVGLGSVVSARINPKELAGAIDASFNVIESEFGSNAAKEYFGSDAFQEIQFCVSTFKGAARWVPFLMSHPAPEDSRESDQENARAYTLSVAWTQFHLAGLAIALNKRHPIAEDVLQALLDGLRNSVMVYAYVRQALELRNVMAERDNEKLNVSWDAEDEALARAN